MELVTFIKVSLNETLIKVNIGKHLSICLLFRMVQNKEMLYCHCFLTLIRIHHYECPRKPRGLNLNGTHQLLLYADDVNLLEDNINTKKKNRSSKQH
jgi:hypothetical protein